MPTGPGKRLSHRSEPTRQDARRAPATFELNVSLPNGTLTPVLVTRKRVKNLNLRVKGDGSVVLSMPTSCPIRTAEEFLARKATWIAAHVRARMGCFGHGYPHGDNPQVPSPAPPQTIPLWGEDVDTMEALGLDEKVAAHISLERLQELVLILYKREVESALPGIVKRYEHAMGVRATRWSIRTMKTRWGSCTPKTGAIRINTRLAAYPPTCLDFVVAHELTHLLEPSHNARFHALLDQLCPGNRRAAALLRKQPEQKEAQAR